MLEFDAVEDANFLQRSMERGEVVLILGAGASASSLNRHDDNVPMANALAKYIADFCGQPYNDESLTDVLAATVPAFISKAQLHKILIDLYCNTTPAEELEDLFKYTWKRLYTLNIDDTVEHCRRGVQRRRYYNGIIDRALEPDSSETLQIIHLHGEAIKPEHGFILTIDEYNSWLNSGNHPWYSQLAEDYANFTPVFVGTRLQEPILMAELHRARGEVGSNLGRAYLITPDDFSPVQKGSYLARNIVPLKGYLGDLAEWLKSKFAAALTPIDVAAQISKVAREIATRHRVSIADVETARSIYMIDFRDVFAEAAAWNPDERRTMAREFLEGGTPTWRIAATDIPVQLEATPALYKDLVRAVDERVRLFVVYGQSGGGKTTALLQSILKLSEERPHQRIYALRGEVKSLKSALQLIEKIHPDEHVIVYIEDAFVFGDSFEEDISSVSAGRITTISTARSGEWRDHLERRVGNVAIPHLFERFSRPDYQPLIDRLLAYVPAPRFLKMTPEERLERLAKSKSQLLIALKETTEASSFDQVITDEFQRLPDDDCRALVLIAGVATLARVGISSGAAREAFDRVRVKRTFDEAMRGTAGIVLINREGRVTARHELYVRHLIEKVADIEVTTRAIMEMLRTFTKYKHPVYKNVHRFDGLLFRFLLNHNFVRELIRSRSDIAHVLQIYKSFEVEFQLDGHFWLQYGQFLVRIGQMENALRVLRKSIEAYPDNEFAVHALADVQLRVARNRPSFDGETRGLIGEAVSTLLQQDARLDWESDQYPIVTLAFLHVGVLVGHRQLDAAKDAATQYFDRVQQLAKRRPDRILERARETLFRFLTTGEWQEGRPNGKQNRTVRGMRGGKRKPSTRGR